MINIKPNQNIGTDWPDRAMTVAMSSIHDPLLVADMIPTDSPTVIAITIAAAESCSVAGRRCKTNFSESCRK
jgi:hypothetical protein